MKIFLIILYICICANTFAQNKFSKYNENAYYSFQQNDFVTAIKNFSKALDYKEEATNSYKVADTYINRGVCRQMLQNYNNAQDDFDEAIKIKPEYVKAYQAKTNSFLQSNQPLKAIEWADKGLEINPNDIELKDKKADALSKLKKYDEALKVLFSVLEDNPRSKNAIKYIGHNYQMKKNWDSALKFFSIAITLDPLDYASFFDRGIAYAEFNDTLNAIKDIEHAMKLDTANRWVGYNNLGFFINLKRKDFTGAIRMFSEAIRLHPEFTNSYCNRGFAKLNLGDIKGAYQDLKKSLDIDNKNSYAYKNLALIYLKEGKKSDACYNLRKALELGYTERYDDEANNLLNEHCK